MWAEVAALPRFWLEAELGAEFDEPEVERECLGRWRSCTPLREELLVHRPADGGGGRPPTVTLTSMSGVGEHREVSDLVGPATVPAHRSEVPVGSSPRDERARDLGQPPLVELIRRDRLE